MFTTRQTASTFSLAAILAFATASEAAVIISNLSADLDTGVPTSSSLYDNNSKAMLFTTPNNGTSYTVGTLTLKLRDQSAVPNTLGTVEAALYASTTAAPFLAGAPTAVVTFTAATPETAIAAGTQLATTPPTSNSGTNYTFTPDSTVNLSPNTSYYLVIDGKAGTTATSVHVFQWLATKTTTGSSDVGAALGSPRFGTRNDLSGGTSSNYNVFQLEGTAAALPEPSIAAAGFFATALSALRRRR